MTGPGAIVVLKNVVAEKTATFDASENEGAPTEGFVQI